jgi:GR25 family glycosyltransferase involved in LPS biosynthesis
MKQFDKIFWINAKNRVDRYQTMKKRFEETGIEAERFEAIMGGSLDKSKYCFQTPILPQKMFLNNGEVGCFQSHREVYKLILENGWQKTLIFEDDALINPEIINSFNEKYSEVPEDWQMLYLGHRNYDTMKNEARPDTFALKKQLTPNVWAADGCWLTHAYAVDLSAVQFLLDNTQVMYGSIDNVLSDIQKHLKVYAFHPNLIVQDKSKSSLRHG